MKTLTHTQEHLPDTRSDYETQSHVRRQVLAPGGAWPEAETVIAHDLHTKQEMSWKKEKESYPMPSPHFGSVSTLYQVLSEHLLISPVVILPLLWGTHLLGYSSS